MKFLIEIDVEIFKIYQSKIIAGFAKWFVIVLNKLSAFQYVLQRLKIN